MKLTEQEKQKFRKDGILIDDFLKVSNMIEKLGLGKNLKKQFDNLLIPLRRKNK